MRPLFHSAFAIALVATPVRAADDAWTPLFNGKDLAGWRIFLNPKTPGDPAKVFWVENGVIACSGQPSGYLITEKEYGDYALKVQWRWKERELKKQNSGVLIHVVGPDMIWPKSMEAQLRAGRAGDLWTNEGFKIKVNEKQHDPKSARHFLRTKDDVEKTLGEWNEYEITCKGDTIKIAVNGIHVNEATEAEVSRGRILLQSEGAPVEFRNIVLKRLEK